MEPIPTLGTHGHHSPSRPKEHLGQGGHDREPGGLTKAEREALVETADKTAMKDMEANFYKQEIQLLLTKIYKMELKSKRQEAQIERLTNEAQRTLMKRSSDGSSALGQGMDNSSVLSRTRSMMELRISEMRNQYEKRIAQDERKIKQY